jgi:tetratricopeptide (TPR) repeat protein
MAQQKTIGIPHEPGGIVPDPATSIPGWREGIPLIRLFACGPFTIEVLHEVPTGDLMQARYIALPPERLHGRGPAPALTFLKLLTSQPDRYAPKDWLIEHLRGDEYLITPKRLENIVSFVRQFLSLPDGTKPPGMLRYVRASHESGDGYRLAPYPLIWLDVDALAANVRQACLLERFGDDALPYWERAYQLACRGTYLAEEPYSDWAEARREEVEGHLRQCVHALARLWLARHGTAAEEEVLHLLRSYWPRPPDDEDVAWGLMDLLGRRGRYQEALEVYAVLEQSLEEQGLTKEGEPRKPDQRTRDLADYLRLKERQSLISPPTRQESASPSPAGTLLPVSSMAATGQEEMLALFSQVVKQGIMQAAGELEGVTMDRLRRQLVGQVLTGTCAVLLASHNLALSSELAERLTKALNKSSYIDEKTLLYLEKRIETYWQDRNAVPLPIPNLLPYALEDLQRLTMLLEGSFLPTVRTHLCTLTGTAAMLIGELYYDMRKYAQARTFQKLALTAAHEANNAALEAVAWGRNSFAWTYDDHPREALHSIQQAQHLAWSVNGTVRTWLAAVEAEIEANLGDREACLKALRAAEHGETPKHHPQESYWIHFDPSLLAGYQGVSLLKLSPFGHHPFVQDAQTALQTALDLLDPSMRRRQPTLLVDLAGTYVQQKQIEQACECAQRAIDIAKDLHSNVLLQRLLTLRNMLEPWKEIRSVQDLDRSMAPLLLLGSQQEGESA